MKTLLSVLFLLLAGFVKAQNTGNNITTDKQVVWSRDFTSSKTFEEVVKAVKLEGVLTDMETGTNIVTGNLRPITADFKGAGYSEMKTPIYIARSNFEGFVSIIPTDTGYMVTVKRLVAVQQYDDGFSKQGEKIALEKLAVKKVAGNILNYTFTNLFQSIF